MPTIRFKQYHMVDGAIVECSEGETAEPILAKKHIHKTKGEVYLYALSTKSQEAKWFKANLLNDKLWDIVINDDVPKILKMFQVLNP